MSPLRRRACLQATLLVLSGCKLIDQTTFAPSPSKNPVLVPAASATPPPVQASVDTRAPLMTIDQGTPVSAYTNVLHGIVAAARQRDPRVEFDVTIVVPSQGDAAAQLAAAQPQATEIMRQIAASGIQEDRLHLRAATDPRLAHRQIRIYVR